APSDLSSLVGHPLSTPATETAAPPRARASRRRLPYRQAWCGTGPSPPPGGSWPAAGCAPWGRPAGRRGRWHRRAPGASAPPGAQRLAAGGGLAGASSPAVSAPWCGAASPAACATGAAGRSGGGGWAWREGRGGSTPWPPALRSPPLRPPATPGSPPVRGQGGSATSAHEKQTYHPAAWRLLGTGVMTPVLGRDQRRARRPRLASTRKPLARWAPVPNGWEVTLA